MKVQRVYTDTSVIGGCFDEEFAPWSNGLMKDFRLGNFEPVVSEIVTAEIEENAPEEVQKQHRWLLDLEPEHLEVGDEVVELASTYIERSVLTVLRMREGAVKVPPLDMDVCEKTSRMRGTSGGTVSVL